MAVDYSKYLRASNGDGPAATAILSDDRPIGSMSVITDNVLNWPSFFVATVGNLDVDGQVTDISVFLGHLEGSIVMIDEFAPGYFDEGYTEGQVIFIKPASAWADIVAGTVSGLVSSVDTIQDTISDFDKKAFLAAHPIGSTYWNETDSRNPGSVWGGTWVALEGVVLGGKSTISGSPFNVAAGTVIGEDAHTLTVAELASHFHRVTSRMHSNGSNNGSAFSITRGSIVSGGAHYSLETRGTTNENIESTGNATGALPTGGNQAHNIIQRTAVGYLWKRTA